LKTSNPQKRNLQKNKQISVKTSPKTSNPQVFRKIRNSTNKASPNSRENCKIGNPEGNVKSLIKTLRFHIIVI